MVSKKSAVEIKFMDNPRFEAAENELVVSHQRFAKLGLRSRTLSDDMMIEIEDIAKKYAHRADLTKIVSTSQWRQPERVKAQKTSKAKITAKSPTVL